MKVAAVTMWGVLLLTLSLGVDADAGPDRALAIMSAVSERPEATRQQAQVRFDLAGANGDIQTREATLLRQVDGDYKKVAMYFTAPRALRNSGFLAWNAADAALEDEQWLYLPSLRRVRRIPARERGQAFLGTDLSYGDIHHVGKLELSDWRFESATDLGAGLWQVQAVAASDEIAEATGYQRARWTVDTRIDFPLKSEFWDPQAQPLKIVAYEQIRERGGSLSADRIEVRNLRNGHATTLVFSQVQIGDAASFDGEQLTPAQLSRGL